MSSTTRTHKVTVGTITGTQFDVPISPSDTVGDVKTRIEDLAAIPSATQILMFRERPLLSDTAPISELGIANGARLQLAVAMASGPGPVARARKAKKEDSVMVVLCKQADGLYMLEFHLKDDNEATKKEATEQLMRLAHGIPPFLLGELMGKSLADDDVEYNYSVTDEDEDGESEDEEIEEDSVESTSDTDEFSDDIVEDICSENSSGESSFSEPTDTVRSQSVCSSMSTSSFLSLLTTPATLSSFAQSTMSNGRTFRAKKKLREMAQFDGECSESNERLMPQSATTTLLEFLSSAESCDTVKGSLGDGLKQDARPAKNRVEGQSATCVIRKKIRPATAISIMRLPKSYVPNITVLKSRPNTAPNVERAALTSVTTSNSSSARDTASGGLSVPTEVAKRNTDQKSKRPVLEKRTLKNNPRVPSALAFPKTGKPPTSAFASSNNLVPSRSQLLSMKESAKRRSSVPKTQSLSARSGNRSSTAKAAVSNENIGPNAKLPPAKATHCFSCNKKLGHLPVFKCKCAHYFCSTHRYSDRHKCTFNFKEAGKTQLEKENPKVEGCKIAKI
ncbi:Rab5 GDP/GTP exchange factor [Entophlyctis luteolus]|nr:Rab5 GDP/GTP exchange factor [Entophlyctis luteolus]KAJ3342320.1 Rab5 GDP/GTP exchange factor [Entophlyctis luteolus]KAJ3377271.1 Rab5 GDP/GTP exchange factor [Entophlyctis sp. JEL0112]